MRFAGHHLIWILIWATAACFIYNYVGSWLTIPALPLSLIGVAVAFYIGFKNNSAYARMWEARKIWGGIVNSSRAFASSTKAYISNIFTAQEYSESELYDLRERIIFRHIAWLYALRCQLLQAMPWEHVSQKWGVGRMTVKAQKYFGIGLVDDEVSKISLKHFLSAAEYDELINYRNTAAQILDRQASDLVELRKHNIIDDFRHMELQKLLNELYVHQGKCERIKKFPMPRQYGSMSSIFVTIFILILPFGMMSEFMKLGDVWMWYSIPFTTIVAWIFLLMELVGDYSENPFEGMANDIPMLSLCRSIENDLLEMLGKTDLPPDIKPKNGILM